jgi:hypothetical protein
MNVGDVLSALGTLGAAELLQVKAALSVLLKGAETSGDEEDYATLYWRQIVIIARDRGHHLPETYRGNKAAWKSFRTSSEEAIKFMRLRVPIETKMDEIRAFRLCSRALLSQLQEMTDSFGFEITSTSTLKQAQHTISHVLSAWPGGRAQLQMLWDMDGTT